MDWFMSSAGDEGEDIMDDSLLLPHTARKIRSIKHQDHIVHHQEQTQQLELVLTELNNHMVQLKLEHAGPIRTSIL
jgi:hypothetical protein